MADEIEEACARSLSPTGSDDTFADSQALALEVRRLRAALAEAQKQAASRVGRAEPCHECGKPDSQVLEAVGENQVSYYCISCRAGTTWMPDWGMKQRAEAAEAALVERERVIAELAEERDEYFSVVGYSRTSEFREKLAALCHEQWSGWMKHLFSKCLSGWDNPKELVVPAWAVERWSRQLTASYDELSEAEKDSDREEADRILFLFSPNPAKGGQ